MTKNNFFLVSLFAGIILDEWNNSVKSKIIAFYEDLGPQYSIEKEVKSAYQAYKDLDPDMDFERYRITQYVLPESVDEENITVTTLVRKNSGECMQELTWDHVFDSSTGEWIE